MANALNHFQPTSFKENNNNDDNKRQWHMHAVIHVWSSENNFRYQPLLLLPWNSASCLQLHMPASCSAKRRTVGLPWKREAEGVVALAAGNWSYHIRASLQRRSPCPLAPHSPWLCPSLRLFWSAGSWQGAVAGAAWFTTAFSRIKSELWRLPFYLAHIIAVLIIHTFWQAVWCSPTKLLIPADQLK